MLPLLLLNFLSLCGSVAGLLALPLPFPFPFELLLEIDFEFGAREINHFVVLPPAIAASDRSRR